MSDQQLLTEGYNRALELVRRAATPTGFVAALESRDNYQRIWGRDGVIVSLAALLTDDSDLHHAALSTLRTLKEHQGPHGEIPSNVDTVQGHVSYGGTAGRVDANLWFVIGCHQYWRRTQDEVFLDEFWPNLQKVEFLLGAWEFNTKGLLYVPETGDWADEYLHHGYVLYDQLLYWRALTGLCELYVAHDDSENFILRQKTTRLRSLIKDNYWFNNHCDPDEVDAYHPVMFAKGCEAAKKSDTYWMAFFSPTGYGYRFDSFANVLVSLFNIADNDQKAATDRYIAEEIIHPDLKVLPAFSPAIDELDEDWENLQATFSNTFKNKPYEFHNGGLWPLLNGFYIADLAQKGQTDLARDYLLATHRANQLDSNGNAWGFYEFINGQTLEPGGTRHQAWSASAAVIGHHALENNQQPL